MTDNPSDKQEQREPLSRAPQQSKEPIRVNVMSIDAGRALVEWRDDKGLHRGYLPADRLETEPGSTYANMSGGVEPYGLNWSKTIKAEHTSDDLNRDFHDVGIWTADDLLSSLQGYTGARLIALGLNLAELRQTVRELKAKE